ncbi:MAG: MATE family efflux transporter, partial [Defluviitaleaceae bacterium]|nr:MATE family efflux transporter [Defluviitaleaceae bacterium]
MKNFNLTQGGILRKLMQVAVPIMGSQFLQLSYTLMDMFWVGRLGDMYGAGPTDGSDAVAATGAAGMFIWLSMAFMFFGRMGAEIGVSQNLGKGDVKEARRFAGNSIFIAAASGLLFGVLCIFAAPWLISFFAIPDAHVAADAATYLMIVGFGFPFVFVSSAINGAFNGSGNSRLPFWANSIGFIINMILSPLLIFPAGLGIMGAAIATVAANLITFGIMLWAMKHNKGRPFERYAFFAKPRLREVKQIFKWSLPISAESLLFTFFSMILTRMVFDADFGGTAAQSVMRIGGEIESLSWLIGGGFGSAVTAFIGQNYGANKWTRIHKGRRIAIATMCVWGGLVMLSFLLFGEQLFTL